MSGRYKVTDSQIPHFITCTIVGWIDLFSREIYKEIVVDSLKYCQAHKALKLHAWVIMTNHLHLIVSSSGESALPEIIRDFKKFTSRKIIDAVKSNAAESRREWLLNAFRFAGSSNNNNENFQFWQQDYHPITLDRGHIYQQRLDYLHENPVRAGIVWEPQHYKYSSAIDYYHNSPGLLPVVRLDY